MNVQVFLSLLLVVFSCNAVGAQTAPVVTLKQKDLSEVTPIGIRVALVKPILTGKVRASVPGASAENSTSLDEAWGVSIGYSKLPIKALGWVANFAYINITEEGSSANLARLDGNLAYALDTKIHVKGGLNLSKFTSGEMVRELNPYFGLQAGLGVQFTPRFGIDAGYTMMEQRGSIQGVDVEFQESGPELMVHGTF